MKNTNSNNSRKFRITSEEKFILFIIITVVIGLIIRGHINKVVEKNTNEIIESAVLVESSDQHYVLSFNGEEHYYSFS